MRIAYAVTIHKSQGMTLNKTIVEPGDRYNSQGQLFVALSRVRRVEDLTLRSLIDMERMKGTPAGQDYLQEDNIRRAYMGFTDPDDIEEFEVSFIYKLISQILYTSVSSIQLGKNIKIEKMKKTLKSIF